MRAVRSSALGHLGPVHPNTNTAYIERFHQRKRGAVGVVPKIEASDLVAMFPPPKGLGKKGEALWEQTLSHYEIGQFTAAMEPLLEQFVRLTLKVQSFNRELGKKSPFVREPYVNNRGRMIIPFDNESFKIYRVVFAQWRSLSLMLGLHTKSMDSMTSFDRLQSMTEVAERSSPRAHLLGGRGREIEGTAEEVEDDAA
jgi:hypothetical protein